MYTNKKGPTKIFKNASDLGLDSTRRASMDAGVKHLKAQCPHHGLYSSTSCCISQCYNIRQELSSS